MPNPVVHFELGCVNTAAQRQFYGSLFDWQMKDTGGQWEYALVQTVEGGITGGISQSGDTPPKPLVTFYVQVDDLQAHLNKAQSLGATPILQPLPMEVDGDKFSIAAFIDPEGNYIGLVQPG